MESERFDNFLGIPPQYSSLDAARFVFFPLPFDKACSWQRGASRGPRAVIEASKNLELWDIETRSEPYLQGVFTAPPFDPADSSSMVSGGYSQMRPYLDKGKFVFTIGGDHSISIGPIKAHVEKFPGMSILHLDAHTDRRDSYEGNKHSHASIIARAQELVPNIVSVGIRSLDKSELAGADESRIFYAHELSPQREWIHTALSLLSDTVYITLDVDVFDVGIMPSTGTPEPGGMAWYDILALLRHTCREKKVIGMDIVELLPTENPAPDFLVAKLIYKMMAYLKRAA